MRTHKISSLPIVILMPHSACNCRCIMCDIWKDNKNLKQLTEGDVKGLLGTLEELNTKLVLMSGGEALLNSNFFSLCALIKNKGIKISLLSTGLSLAQHAQNIVKYIDDVIVSIDGTEEVHNSIRRIPNAFSKLREGIKAIKTLQPHFRISSRSVIQKENFRIWAQMIKEIKQLGIDQLSFLPADVSSTAFNHINPGTLTEGLLIQPEKTELRELHSVIENILEEFKQDFRNKTIAESPDKIKAIGTYYAALYGLNPFPEKACNAPWVSTVIEADGTLRPCFFLEELGNIKETPFKALINSSRSVAFRQQLNTQNHPMCERCVCSLYLSPFKSL